MPTNDTQTVGTGGLSMGRLRETRLQLLNRWIRWEARGSNLVHHTERELPHPEEDGPDLWMRDNLIDLVSLFSTQGHSGGSAAFATAALSKLLAFEPLGPLTGADDEWLEVGHGVFQNLRCSRVFKEDGQAYDIEGIVFRETNGACFTNSESRVPVTFPYTPTTEYHNAD